jgi:hypothetical protein
MGEGDQVREDQAGVRRATASGACLCMMRNPGLRAPGFHYWSASRSKPHPGPVLRFHSTSTNSPRWHDTHLWRANLKLRSAQAFSNSAGQRNDQPDRARPRAVVAAAQPHRPIAVHCSSAGLAQRVRFRTHTWALRTGAVRIRIPTWVLRTDAVHTRSRTAAPRTGPVHNRSRSWARRIRVVRLHSHSRVLRTPLFHIHCRSRGLRTQLLH